ncbi:MAG: pitrilysin family protein, partial [Armatimonadota bacterium]|nr:pitrilysin family protein [Armatimonadota bacterium]
ALLAYHRNRYVPGNTVVAAAGSVDHHRLAGLSAEQGAKRARPPARAPRPRLLLSEAPAPTVEFVRKDTEQYHVCVGAAGLARSDERRFAASVLDNVLGGSASSRLFQEIREKRGLVYTITSYHTAYREGGLLVIYGAMSPSAAPEVTTLILQEIEKIKDGISPAELQRAKESYKGAVMLSLESTGSRMSRLARSQIYYGRQISLDEFLARIDAVTTEQVQAMAQEVLVPQRMAMAAIGPFRNDGRLAAALQEAFRAESTATT